MRVWWRLASVTGGTLQTTTISSIRIALIVIHLSLPSKALLHPYLLAFNDCIRPASMTLALPLWIAIAVIRPGMALNSTGAAQAY
jgi:hypothetical protein